MSSRGRVRQQAWARKPQPVNRVWAKQRLATSVARTAKWARKEERHRLAMRAVSQDEAKKFLDVINETLVRLRQLRFWRDQHELDSLNRKLERLFRKAAEDLSLGVQELSRRLRLLMEDWQVMKKTFDMRSR